MEYVKINGNEYPAEISGVTEDYEWDKRESKTIKFSDNVLDYETICNLFIEGAAWSIISVWTTIDPETGEEVEHREEFDNSDFSVAGSVTNMRDGGTFTVKMGKLTELESFIEDIYGGAN